MKTLILKSFNPSKLLILTTDASDYAVEATLEMYDKNSKAVIGVVAYLRRALHGHGVNGSIREKDFLLQFMLYINGDIIH